MAARRSADPAKTRAAVSAVADWLRDDSLPEPERAELGEAVRLTARTLAAMAPGASVEVRVPPFVAVQCISGPRAHARQPAQRGGDRSAHVAAAGHRPARGRRAAASGALQLSGARAGEIADMAAAGCAHLKTGSANGFVGGQRRQRLTVRCAGCIAGPKGVGAQAYSPAEVAAGRAGPGSSARDARTGA